MRLKATKTSLYKLIAEYAKPSAMVKTVFIKAYRSPSYWLEWSANGVTYKAYLSACMGNPLFEYGATELTCASERINNGVARN